MRTDFYAIMNDVNLLNVSEQIYIEDIREDPKVNVPTENRMSYGLFVVGEPEREELDITIKLMIKERNRENRQRIISEINGWAKKGWLQINLRANQRIYVYCTQPLQSESYKTSESMELKFAAYNEAYWQEIIPRTVALSGSSGSANLTPLGTRYCFLEAEVTNTSESTITGVTITGNGQSIVFAEISLAAGATLNMKYDERHLLTAKIGSTSILDKRTETSVDHIKLPNKEATTVSFTATGSCSVKMIARGLYD